MCEKIIFSHDSNHLGGRVYTDLHFVIAVGAVKTFLDIFVDAFKNIIVIFFL